MNDRSGYFHEKFEKRRRMVFPDARLFQVFNDALPQKKMALQAGIGVAKDTPCEKRLCYISIDVV